MKSYVKEYHTTGLTWNPSVRSTTNILRIDLIHADQGIATSEYKAPSTAGAAAGGAPPPPPPPPPGPPPPPAAAPAATTGGGMGAVFADLNRGEDVTKGLRKVDKSEMTHKNPALRAGNTVPAAVGASGEHDAIELVAVWGD